MKRLALVAALCLATLGVGGAAGAPTTDVRVTNDCVVPTTPDPGPGYLPPPGCPATTTFPGYTSSYTLATGVPYTDAILSECTIAHGRQNEPAIEADPRDLRVLIGSSNDYCGVYAGRADGVPVPTGPIWLGYYRSENAGGSFVDSLVPGYPGDTSPFAALAQIRTASSGDPVVAWDAEGRVFLGSESSDDPAGTPKTFGDVWVARYVNPGGPGGATINDGKRYEGTTLVARGSSAPNLLGKFNDKTALAADHNSDGRCDNDVYFAWSRFTGQAQTNAIYFTRSTDHGVTFSHAAKISTPVQGVQFADIAVTGNSNVYVAFRGFESQRGQPDAVYVVRSTDCGDTFSRPQLVTTFVPYDAQDVGDPEPTPTTVGPDEPGSDEGEEAPSSPARDCGDFASHCLSGYTFFRRDTQVRATADQFDRANPDRVYLVYDPTKPGTEVPTGTSYGSVASGIGSQSAVYFAALNGATMAFDVAPRLIDSQATGHQLFPDISADTPPASGAGHATVLHAIWWDSRGDPCYSATRPVGNCDDRTTVASLDAWGAVSTNGGGSWTSTRMSDVATNPNYEQFSDRTVPFAGDYLWVTQVGTFGYGVWTDWRDTRQGGDPRELPEDEDAGTADVYQCRVLVTVTGKKGATSQAWSGDRCPHSGGLDQNIYGDQTP